MCGAASDEAADFSLRATFRVVEDEELRGCPPLRDALWAVLEGWPPPRKRALVRFVTGSARPPQLYPITPTPILPLTLARTPTPTPVQTPNSNPNPDPDQARLPAAGTELLRVQMPFVAFGAAEVASFAQTLPQSHTCDDLLEPLPPPPPLPRSPMTSPNLTQSRSISPCILAHPLHPRTPPYLP